MQNLDISYHLLIFSDTWWNSISLSFYFLNVWLSFFFYFEEFRSSFRIKRYDHVISILVMFYSHLREQWWSQTSFVPFCTITRKENRRHVLCWYSRCARTRPSWGRILLDQRQERWSIWTHNLCVRGDCTARRQKIRVVRRSGTGIEEFYARRFFVPVDLRISLILVRNTGKYVHDKTEERPN